MEKKNLFLHVTNALQEKEPVKTVTLKYESVRLLFWLIKISHAEITIRCNMTTGKTNSGQSSDVLRRENAGLLCQHNTAILPPHVCSTKSLYALILRFTYVILKRNAESIHVKKYVYYEMRVCARARNSNI